MLKKHIFHRLKQKKIVHLQRRFHHSDSPQRLLFAFATHSQSAENTKNRQTNTEKRKQII